MGILKANSLKKKHNQQMFRATLEQLRKWAVYSAQLKASGLYELEEKMSAVESIRKKIYWNKLLEYTKSRQIKKIQREFIAKTRKNLLTKRYFIKWLNLSLIHICRCRRIERCRSRWSPYH
eukprot:TRINITY_DN12737_c0_g4_i1.p1 TRINITY_DN12737_c0_g4~~TRINITY_DN12737_c0_g4_i1.p1  ORF type:complete len:121 (-),score=14.45 TRINITY_DN12737_c0_g4_i1:1-363(-)